MVRNVLAVVIITGLGYAAYVAKPSSFGAPSVEAGTGENTSGFAWSETIGWISFNSTSDISTDVSYGVIVDTANKATGGTGVISGTAWSRGADETGGVGWISFDRVKTGNPPAAPFDSGLGPIAQVDWSTGKVTGWARALAGCEEIPGAPAPCSSSSAGAAAGGWDGWIKLSDDTTVPVWSGKGVKISGNRFSGYAWGGDVVGWVDFAPKVAGVDVGVQVAVPCTVAEVDASGSWGSCQALTPDCTGKAGQTLTGLLGIRVGVCSSDGTTLGSCSTASYTCPAATTKPIYQQF